MASENKFTLLGKTMTGQEINVDVTGSSKVLEVKQQIAEVMGCSTGSIRILAGRKMLKNDTETVASYGLEKTSKIKIIIQLEVVKPAHEDLIVDGGNVQYYALALSYNDKILATGCTKGSLNFYDVSTGVKKLSTTGHSDTLRCVRFNQDTTRVVTSGYDNKAKLWALNTREWTIEMICEFQFTGSRVSCCDISGDGSFFIAGSEGKEMKIIAEDGNLLFNCPVTKLICCCRLSRNGSFFICGGAHGQVWMYGMDGELRHQVTAGNTASGGSLDNLIRCCDIAKNMEYFLVGTFNHFVHQFDTESGEQLRCFKFQKKVFFLGVMKHDEYFCATGGFLVRIGDENPDDHDPNAGKSEIFHKGRCLGLAVAHYKNAFICYSENSGFRFKKLKEEEFFACLTNGDDE